MKKLLSLLIVVSMVTSTTSIYAIEEPIGVILEEEQNEAQNLAVEEPIEVDENLDIEQDDIREVTNDIEENPIVVNEPTQEVKEPTEEEESTESERVDNEDSTEIKEEKDIIGIIEEKEEVREETEDIEEDFSEPTEESAEEVIEEETQEVSPITEGGQTPSTVQETVDRIPTVNPEDILITSKITLIQNGWGGINTSSINITNTSEVDIEITQIMVLEHGEWELVDFNANFKTKTINSKEFGLRIEGLNINSNNTDVAGRFDSIIKSGEQRSLNIDIKLPGQEKTLSESMFKINVVWEVVESSIPIAVVTPAPSEVSQGVTEEMIDEVIKEEIIEEPKETEEEIVEAEIREQEEVIEDITPQDFIEETTEDGEVIEEIVEEDTAEVIEKQAPQEEVEKKILVEGKPEPIEEEKIESKIEQDKGFTY